MPQAPALYAVIGHPVAHSRSPQIHAEFARLTGQAMHYTRIEAALHGFAAALREFLASGGQGANVTLPFKEEAYALSHVHTVRAKQARVVNTLAVHADGTLLGDNTDGAGLLVDLKRNHQVSLQGARILLLGAGGAARGILPALLEEKPALVQIANRTPERARKLAARRRQSRMAGGGFEELQGQSFDVVINATSASLTGELPPLPRDCLNPGAVCYDLAYGERATVFMLWAEQAGAAQVLDGWGMLVEQAAESFYLWRGLRPPTATLLALHP
ncbi:MAG: shikimate dehydrogenase [Gammaproteobacteria bacterium]|nr:shikimate dehydrogenase [Gammaproteobacteria bacterium]MBU6510293.1 shikimate dehydrogenase [Gammaproteobacteria bacterium]MDE1984283.1 shikimate dehydrogenase [Gammaproteobacteria bacterium]MDE2108232.1 shikimate dehydrogenase [Gammaproteobacteria bacterium]MDE2460135.1 shikimate dehydrogenase [Gammaproteobacteria bacterium]